MLMLNILLTDGPAPYESKGIGESSSIPVVGADLPVTADKALAGLKPKRGG